ALGPGAQAEKTNTAAERDAGVELEANGAGIMPARPQRAGRKPVSDQVYAEKLRALIAEAGGVIPSAREAARQLGVGQDRARRLIALVSADQAAADESAA